MRRQKHRSAMLKKIVVVFAAVVLIVAATISGTLAWLTAKTGTVTNTFTVGNIEIDIKEVKLDTDSKNLVIYDQYKEWGTNGQPNNVWVLGNEYKFVPGDTLEKKATVKVSANSEKCYLFIHVAEKNNENSDLTGKIISWAVDAADDQWIQVPGQTNYWYRIVDASLSDQFFDILKAVDSSNSEDNVTVNENITKEMVETINAEATKPKLSFKAAAIQFDNIEDSNNDGSAVDEAWDKLPADF